MIQHLHGGLYVLKGKFCSTQKPTKTSTRKNCAPCKLQIASNTRAIHDDSPEERSEDYGTKVAIEAA